MASPIAKNSCCRSSLRRNSTGTRSAAEIGPAAARAAAASSSSRAAWWARSSATRRAMPRNGSPCDGSTSVSAGSASNGDQRVEEACQRVGFGLDRPDADVGADPRQQHVAGDQHARPRPQYSDACSGEWPWPSITRHDRPPARRRLAVADPGESWPGSRARRGGSGCRGRTRPARPLAGQPVAREQRDDRVVVVPAVAAAQRVRGQELGVRHRHRRAEACRQPGGVADVVGVAVGDDDPLRRSRRPASSRAAFPRARASARRRSRSRPA